MEDSSLLASSHAADGEHSTEKSVWVDVETCDPRYHPHLLPDVSPLDDLVGRTIRIVDTFHYSKITPANPRIGQRAVSAYGHMGVMGARARSHHVLPPREMKPHNTSNQSIELTARHRTIQFHMSRPVNPQPQAPSLAVAHFVLVRPPEFTSNIYE